MKRIITASLLCLLFFLSCSESDSNTLESNCDTDAQIVESTVYDQVNINYAVTSVTLNEDCLDITVSSSGCDPNNWEMNLFSTADFTSTAIPQKNLKVELVNQEACLAVFQKTVSFSLIPYRLDGQNEINLFIEGWASPINYTY